jgi:ABC-2 type transport system ATP-binding protein
MFELKGISKSFYEKQVLHDLSLEIKAGEIFGLLGPNGAGKSTLIRIMNQIVEADSGHIKYNQDLFRQQHLQNFGYLPEERGLYRSMTVEQHGFFLARLRGLSKKEAKTNLDYWLDRLKITDWRNKRIEELSKGMAQKVQFIFTVLHQPKVIILDEPFSGFDPLNIEIIRKEIYQLKEEGRAILISTHNMNSVEEICDKVLLIHQGKKILEGPVQELREGSKKGQVNVRFKGNMIGFVNALWAGYTVENQCELNGGRFEVELSFRKDNTMKDLMAALMNVVEIEAIEEKLPSMQEVFINAIEGEEMKTANEE